MSSFFNFLNSWSIKKSSLEIFPDTVTSLSGPLTPPCHRRYELLPRYLFFPAGKIYVGEAHQAASSEQLTKGPMTKRRRQAAAQKIQMHPVRAAVAAPDSLKPLVIHVPWTKRELFTGRAKKYIIDWYLNSTWRLYGSLLKCGVTLYECAANKIWIAFSNR